MSQIAYDFAKQNRLCHDAGVSCWNSDIRLSVISDFSSFFRFMNKAVTENFHALQQHHKLSHHFSFLGEQYHLRYGLYRKRLFVIQRFLRSDTAVSLTLQTDTTSISLCMKISTMCHVFRFSRTPRKLRCTHEKCEYSRL